MSEVEPDAEFYFQLFQRNGMFSFDLRDPPRLAIFANTIFDLREHTQLEKSTKTLIFDHQICAIFPAGSLSHFARSFPKSRAKCRITLRDKLYELLAQFEFVLDSARSASKTPNFTPKHATKSLEIAIFAHMLNLALAQNFSNEFSGTPRVLPDLHMVQDSQHKQPQPKRIDESRVTPK